jgi:hypothetical protein
VVASSVSFVVFNQIFREEMRMFIRTGIAVAVAGAVVLGGCAAEEGAEEAAPMEEAAEQAAASSAMVAILTPTDGSEVVGTEAHVTFQVAGVVIAPAGTADPGTGHHHLFLDTDLTPLDQPIPMDTPGITHLGQAQTEHHFTDLAPGEHRIIAVVADGAHIPLNPPVIDTVTFTVRAP